MEMKKLTLLISILFIVEVSFSQITFQKTYGGPGGGDYGLSVQQTTDKGYIIAGTTGSFSIGSLDIYLIKTDSIGDTLWTKTFGEAGYDLMSVQQTSDGGFIVGGSTFNFKFYLIKTDINGNLLWTKTFGGVNGNVGYSAQETSDSGYIITGYTTSFGAGNSDVYLVKTDELGNLLWSKTYGGTNLDIGWSVQQTMDGGYIITGETISFASGFSNVYLIKTDINGDSVWTKSFGGTNTELGYSVQQTTDSGYIVTGATYSFGAGLTDVYLVKTDSNGNLLWSKTYGGIDYDLGRSVQQTTDGGYIISGYTESFSGVYAEVYLIKTDSNGNLLWSKTFGGADVDVGYSALQTPDGGYVIAGITASFGLNSGDVYLIKTDSLGNSGCNEGIPSTIVSTPPTQVSSFTAIVTSPATIATSPITIVGSGGIVNTLCTAVGTNEIISDNLFLIYPNPSAGNFNISYEGIIISGNVEILNTLGEKIFAYNISKESNSEISLKNISKGIYLVKVFNGVKSYCKKIIIE